MGMLAHLSVILALSSHPFASSAIISSFHSNSNYNDNGDTPLPLIIWHGLGDTYTAEGLRSVGDLVEQVNPGTYVYYVHLGKDESSDRSASWFGNVSAQIDLVCEQIASDPILNTAPKVDALGFSQGGQLLRGYIERCNQPPVRSLVTFGSQHNGISSFRKCNNSQSSVDYWLCRSGMALLRGGTWTPWTQSHFVPAQYFRDPSTAEGYEQYLAHSNFLADINNERRDGLDTGEKMRQELHKRRLSSLEQFAMYMFSDDTIVVPKESSWFEEVNGTESTPLRARPLYSQDWLGLRALDREGGLKFRSTPGDHMTLDDALLNATFAEFFGPLGKHFLADEESGMMDEL